MKRLHKILIASAALSLIAILAFFSGPVAGKAEYSKDTGKKCAFCHDGSPKDGKLTKEGDCFKKNGNKQGSCW